MRTETNRSAFADIVLISATVAAGLIAGVYYGFSCGVMPGLAQADDLTLIRTMQRINVAIVNPAFALSFVGALVLPAGAALLQWRAGNWRTFRWTLAATILYLLSLAVTIGANIPLNDALAHVGDTNTAAVRQWFEEPWCAWNIVRGVLSTASLVCLCRALTWNNARYSE